MICYKEDKTIIIIKNLFIRLIYKVSLCVENHVFCLGYSGKQLPYPLPRYLLGIGTRLDRSLQSSAMEVDSVQNCQTNVFRPGRDEYERKHSSPSRVI